MDRFSAAADKYGWSENAPAGRYLAQFDSYRIIESSKSRFNEGELEIQFDFICRDEVYEGMRFETSIFPLVPGKKVTKQDGKTVNIPPGTVQIQKMLACLGVELSRDDFNEDNIFTALEEFDVTKPYLIGYWNGASAFYPNEPASKPDDETPF